LSKISFLICIFFIFFGTDLPFQAKSGGGVEEIVESNIVNQLVFTSLFLLALVTLIPKYKYVITFIKSEKFFSLFFLWCAITILWSDYSFVAFKRYFQYLTIFLVILSILSYIENLEKISELVKYILITYLFVSLISLIIPRAFDSFGNFKGIASSKNAFGQIAFVCAVLWGSLFSRGNLKGKTFYLLLLILSIALVILSRSMTMIAILMLVAILNYLLKINKEFEVLGFKKIFFFVLIIFFSAFILSIIILTPETLNIFFRDMGKDMTLTGRTEIWGDILNNAKSHIFWGCGYQSFWVSDNPFIEDWYQTHFWILMQSHNGYIDIINELGIVGAILFTFIIIKFLRVIGQLKNNGFYLWIFIATLILNLTESTIIRPQHPTGVMLMLAYLIAQKNILNKNILTNNYQITMIPTF
jgi:O-antigen ligase